VAILSDDPAGLILDHQFGLPVLETRRWSRIAVLSVRRHTLRREATYAMRASFAAGEMAPGVLKFFDALVALPTGGGQRP